MLGDPRATYRLQLHHGFGFLEAAAVAGYLSDLGVSHVYASPYLQAAEGSTHGYDVVDHHQVNEDLGGPEAHRRFCLCLGEAGLGQLLDIVPNHMAVNSARNRWWWDVLENGPSSRYASYFDVEWESAEARHNAVLLPVLGDHYGKVLEAGELKLQRRGGGFVLRYYEHLWPVAPRSLDQLLAAAAARCGSDELGFIADALGRLPLSTVTDPQVVHRRHRDKEVLRELLDRLCREQPQVAAAVDAQVEAANADPDELDRVIDRQNYRPGFWRAAAQDLGYRRFFDINSLAGLRVEDERTFVDTHRVVLQWLREGVIDGLRVDHPDGLRDPEGYFRKLQEVRPGAWVVGEKILMPGERLRPSWPLDGTTGYDFLNEAGGLFVDPRGEEPITRAYAAFTGAPTDWPAVLREKKHQILRDVLGSDLNRLTALFLEICQRHRRHRDYTRNDLHHALRETIACLPVYRTYVRAEAGEVGAEDARDVGAAIAAARAARPELDPELFEFLRRLLLLEVRGEAESELVMRFQQLSGPAMAKGGEDTAFYSYLRFVALNEVGGDPGRFGVAPEAFHAHCALAAERWPRTLLATSTHDTKRSEDVRSRLALLSEVPEAWSDVVRQLARQHEGHRTRALPDPNTEYLFYQVLVGAWPLEPERAWAFMEKAAREAKAHTSWTSPNAEYEGVLRRFVEGVMADPASRALLADFVQPLLEPGRINSLALCALKMTAPGIPDIYQGCELWDLSLVDPDNRRPVDFERRRNLLRELRDLRPEEVWRRQDEGLPKLWLLRQALRLRREQPEAFGPRGAYTPLAPAGERSGHVVAFRRGDTAVTVVPRLVMGLGGTCDRLAAALGRTTLTLPPGRWANVLTSETVEGGEVPVGRLLQRFPVAIFGRGD